MIAGLPAPSRNFEAEKSVIVQGLDPDATSRADSGPFVDASPKGTVDEGIRDVLERINACDGLVTTSSCAGRVSVFADGKKVLAVGDDDPVDAKPAKVGGKGLGGRWLLLVSVSWHRPSRSSRRGECLVPWLRCELGVRGVLQGEADADPLGHEDP